MIVLVILTAVAALAWAYLLTAHGAFWRTGQRLPPAPDRTAPAGPGGRAPDGSVSWPDVVVVIPARDEAPILPRTLPTLLAQDYPGRLEIILIDDDSTDGTAGVATGLATAAPAGRLRVLPGTPTPRGWAGKVWAMAQGLRAAGEASFVLFTDADISYAPGTVTALARSAGDRYDLVSQMALLRAESGWERLLVPAFVYFFAQLYPFRRVNRPQGRTAAAAGGCMLVRRAALAAVGGLDPIRGARIDDVALGRLLKRRAGAGRCWLGLSTDVRSLREYDRLAQLWDMIARSAYTQLRYSPPALAGTVAGLAWLYLLPPVATLAGLAVLAAGTGPLAGWLAVAGAAGWALMSVSFLPMLRLYRLAPLRALTLPVIAALYAAMTADSARRHHRGRGGEWKGRVIPAG